MAPTTRSPSSSSRRPLIAVIGSLNIDLVSRVARVPDGGETLTSSSFDIGFGGKGANQAVACARLSRPKHPSKRSLASAEPPQSLADVRMYGAIGTDPFAAGYLEALAADGIDAGGVRKLEGYKTGVAVVLVEESTGENRILVHPGANHGLKGQKMVESWDGISLALFQLEIPIDTVLQTIQDAQSHKVETILNPAPAVALSSDIYSSITHLILNESEAGILCGQPARAIDLRTPSHLASVFHYFLSKGVKAVIVTLGAQGVVYQTFQQQTGSGFKHIPAKSVKVVDTTAAGDTFVGAFAIAWATNGTGEDNFDARVDFAVNKANEAASITVQREGAQSAVPWMNEIPSGMTID